MAPDYAAVPEEVLERAAEKGHSIHKEIDLFVKEGKEPESNEAKCVVEWMRSCFAKGRSEVIVGNDDTLAGWDTFSSVMLVGEAAAFADGAWASDNYCLFRDGNALKLASIA